VAAALRFIQPAVINRSQAELMRNRRTVGQSQSGVIRPADSNEEIRTMRSPDDTTQRNYSPGALQRLRQSTGVILLLPRLMMLPLRTVAMAYSGSPMSAVDELGQPKPLLRRSGLA